MGNAARSQSVSRIIHFTRESFAGRHVSDTAVSRALLERVSAGLEPETLRLYRPVSAVAFGPADTVSSGYATACEAARQAGFDAIERLAGGRAAVFHEETIAFAWVIPDGTPRAHVHERFEVLSEIVAGALGRLGIDARVGPVPGEYCCGDFSVNARGRHKLMGVGQRLVSNAGYIGGVVVVGDSERLREVLVAVYQALDLDWDPTTVGSVRDELETISYEEVEQALIEEFDSRYELVNTDISHETILEAERWETVHLSP